MIVFRHPGDYDLGWCYERGLVRLFRGTIPAGFVRVTRYKWWQDKAPVHSDDGLLKRVYWSLPRAFVTKSGVHFI